MSLTNRLEKLESKITLPKKELINYFFIVDEGEDFDKAMNEVIKKSNGLLKRNDFNIGNVGGDKWCFPEGTTVEDALDLLYS